MGSNRWTIYLNELCVGFPLNSIRSSLHKSIFDSNAREPKQMWPNCVPFFANRQSKPFMWDLVVHRIRENRLGCGMMIASSLAKLFVLVFVAKIYTWMTCVVCTCRTYTRWLPLWCTSMRIQLQCDILYGANTYHICCLVFANEKSFRDEYN